MKGTNIETLVGKRFGEGVVTHVEKYEAREGTDVGQIYKIDFEISYGGLSHINNTMMIPERWNERFVGIGNGGIAGILGTGWYCFAENGYAAVQSDLGTSAVRRGEIETAYEGLWADYGHRAVHGSTMVAKAILEYVKGKPPVYSYFYGASAGGKSALSEVQRHPNDYDGVVAGVPSNNGLAFVTYLLWCYRRLGGDKGQPLFGEKLSQKINDCAVEFCKAHGDAGEPEDDFMTFPYYGKNTVAEFIDYLKIKLPELNKEQLEALEAVYTGPKNPRTGEQIFCGMPIGSELNTGYFLGDGITCGFDLPWYQLFFGKEFDNNKFDFDLDYERIFKGIGEHMSTNSPELSEFEAHGGKLIVYSGAADPYGPFADHLNYYRRVCDRMGGADRVNSFFRLFIIPGRGHSVDGKGANMFVSEDAATDMIAVVRAWREDGKAPEYLEVAHKYSDEMGGGYKFKRKVPPVTNPGKEGIDYPVCTSERLLHNKPL